MLWLYPYGYHQHRGDLLLYHSDHLGSTSYITDAKPNITQFDVYLPYGELLVDEHTSSEDMPYKFNGKEFDEETGLYYYGARYMNPVISSDVGVEVQLFLCDINGNTLDYSHCINTVLDIPYRYSGIIILRI